MALTNTPTSARRSLGLLASGAALGVIASFISTVLAFARLEASGDAAVLIGADNELGYPASGFALIVFAIAFAAGIAESAGAVLSAGWDRAIVALLAVGTMFEIWTLYLAIMGSAALAFTIVELLLMIGILVLAAIRMPRGGTDTGIGIFLVVAAVGGFFAAMRLTVDKVGTFVDPGSALSCDVSPLVQCGENLASWQGSLFGFPNPLIGVGGWVAVFMVGVMLLSGFRFARWFWIVFNIGVAGALVFVCWLIYQSIFIIGTLCPWCMATWSVTIPTFWLVTLYNLKSGAFGARTSSRRFFTSAYGWVPLLTFASYVVVALLAQLRLDVIHGV